MVLETFDLFQGQNDTHNPVLSILLKSAFKANLFKFQLIHNGEIFTLNHAIPHNTFSSLRFIINIAGQLGE